VKKLVAAITFLTILAGQGMLGVNAADLPLRPPPEKAVPEKPKAGTGFEKLGADCVAATDGCRGYVRAADGKFDPTNNIGISCQPQPLACTKRR
jgi:hypothetical protein